MFKFKNKLILAFVCSIILCSECKNKNQWSIIILVQHWLPTTCKMHMSLSSSMRCRMPVEADSWTVHGIWPSHFDQQSPDFCNYLQRFNQQDLRAIQHDLDEAWPDTLEQPISIWAHEWSKHGTCIGLPEWNSLWNSPIQYFKLGIALRTKYDLKSILHKADIQPSHNITYTVEQFENAIQKSIGHMPRVKCFRQGDKQYVVEVYICLSQELKTIDCNFKKKKGLYGLRGDHNRMGLTNCDRDTKVIYDHASSLL